MSRPEDTSGGREASAGETLPSNEAVFAASPGTASASYPPIQPTVAGAYSHGWTVFKDRFWRLLLLCAVTWAVSAVGGAVLQRTGAASGLLWLLFEFLVVTPLGFGLAWSFLRAARGSRPQVDNLWTVFRRNYVGGVLAGALLGIAIVIGLVLFVIPGIILAVRLAFVPFLVADEGLGTLDALRASWRRTSGHSWTLVGVGVLGILACAVGLLLLVVGVIPASILVYLAFASLYAAVSPRSSAV